VSGTRGAANRSLYRARILLDCWDEARDHGRIGDAQLRDAFLPAVRLHLREAYGWFLLAVAGQDAITDDTARPSCTAELTPPEAGKAVAPELREFELLERDGWIADLMAWPAAEEGPAGAPSMVLGSDRSVPGLAVAESWWQHLNGIMQRMDDLLVEC
jgi:hypothetical protein